MNKKLLLWIVLPFVFLMAPSVLLAESYLIGNITAEAGDWGELGSWKYTLYVTWDTGTNYGLSHLDLIVDDGTHCTCSAIGDAINWDTPPGYFVGEEGLCQMGLDTELNCQGDPSIDVWSPLFKFEPNEGPDCHAGPVGEMTIVFYSNFSPAPIADPNLFLVDKYSQYSEFGMVTGVFPGLPCDPIANTAYPWAGLKAIYR